MNSRLFGMKMESNKKLPFVKRLFARWAFAKPICYFLNDGKQPGACPSGEVIGR